MFKSNHSHWSKTYRVSCDTVKVPPTKKQSVLNGEIRDFSTIVILDVVRTVLDGASG